MQLPIKDSISSTPQSCRGYHPVWNVFLDSDCWASRYPLRKTTFDSHTVSSLINHLLLILENVMTITND